MVNKVFTDIKAFYSDPEKFAQTKPQKAIIYSVALKILSVVSICFGLVISNYYFIAPFVLYLGASLYLDYKVINAIPYYLNQQKEKMQALMKAEIEKHLKENLDNYIEKYTQILVESKIDRSTYVIVDKVINDDPEYKGYHEGKIARRFLGGLFFERPKGWIKGLLGY